MPIYTTTLSVKLLNQLSQFSKELKIPTSELVQKALEIYLRELDKAALAADFRALKGDKDMLEIAKEGMTDYLTLLNKWEKVN